MADLIQVTFGSIADGATDSRTTAATMDGLLGDLRAYLAPLVAEWSGSASEAYNAQQAKWDRGAAQIHDVLGKIGMQLSNAHDRYTTAEAQNTARFS